MDRIAKDVGDIQSRLFDHKPVLQGEIRYFVREFEEKRGLREKRLLDNVNSMISEVHGRGVPELQDSMQSSTSAILMRLEAANHMTQRILQRDSVKEQERSDKQRGHLGEITTRIHSPKPALVIRHWQLRWVKSSSQCHTAGVMLGCAPPVWMEPEGGESRSRLHVQ
ncbi:biogenesis of lysosome-related organelles complex 1 subunit 5 isoform X1 [Polypterus senegalus]|uniref:biogenesis of lysosome-related organelles complex 1 subunit 5 isoform X1 n=1 Tax=Polypterus senegalus TaxID=55291 RepID=UPI00196536E5|nr:biogenesis of lysosome-related organelles complex 1 subunit 5 isoform X1 [Polypterus senegalus]